MQALEHNKTLELVPLRQVVVIGSSMALKLVSLPLGFVASGEYGLVGFVSCTTLPMISNNLHMLG